MFRITWRNLLIFILLLAITAGIVGCKQLDYFDRYGHLLSSLPERIEQGIVNLLGGISNIGSALAQQIKNIIGSMTGQ